MIHKQLQYIQEYLPFINKKQVNISKATVGWHLDHMLKVINAVFEGVKNSNPKEYKKQFNGLRLLFFTMGFFPRGKAKAPKRVMPPVIILKEEIERQLKLAIQNLATINDIGDNQYFTHPLFKQLNKKQTLYFLKLHTHHHLKIVKEILR